jgi:hypothetical protein
MYLNVIFYNKKVKMKATLFLIFFILTLSSCGKFEEYDLLNYSDENKSYQITKIVKNLTENDSLYYKEQSIHFYDKQNRLINSNNVTFYFYNSNGKISETKSIYKRKGRDLIPKIFIEKYFYDKRNSLIKIADITKKEEPLKTLKYNKLGKLISEFSFLETIYYEYSNNNLSKKTIIEDGKVSKISEYKYNASNKVIIEDWVFNDTKNRMRTYYTYYPNKKIFSKRDSCYSKTTDPNEYIEFLTEYYYDKKDSIIEIRNLGRVLSETKFKLRGKTKFEYKKILMK